tara:strand:+ start:377 stop:694 length:318 start_codon:yes stop_codon:yes gene_type:complete
VGCLQRIKNRQKYVFVDFSEAFEVGKSVWRVNGWLLQEFGLGVNSRERAKTMISSTITEFCIIFANFSMRAQKPLKIFCSREMYKMPHKFWGEFLLVNKGVTLCG